MHIYLKSSICAVVLFLSAMPAYSQWGASPTAKNISGNSNAPAIALTNGNLLKQFKLDSLAYILENFFELSEKQKTHLMPIIDSCRDENKKADDKNIWAATDQYIKKINKKFN